MKDFEIINGLGLNGLRHHVGDSGVHLSPNGVKAPTVTMIAMVAPMVCVVIMTIQIIHTLYIYRKNMSPQSPQLPQTS